MYFEKLDGTLTDGYLDPTTGLWCVATRQVPDGDSTASNLNGEHYTNRSLFEKCIGTDFHTWCQDRQFESAYTHMFELTTPLNSPYVHYEDFEVTLLGLRNTATGEELDPREYARDRGIRTPKVYKFGSLQETLAYIHSQPPRKHEGMVARGLKNSLGVYERSKIKNAAYVAAAHAMEANLAASTRSIMTLILTGSLDDMEGVINQHRMDIGRQMRADFDAYARYQDARYAELVRPGMERKEVARICGSNGLNVSSCFAVYDGKAKGFYDWVFLQQKADGWSSSFLDDLATRSKGYASK